MDIKGTAVMAIRDYVKENYPNQFIAWKEALPEDIKSIYNGMIDATKWYPAEKAAAIPTSEISRMFFNNNVKKGAWESGRYSAEKGLKGIYKFYVKAASPGHLISRASRIFAAYYQPCKLTLIKSDSKSATLHLCHDEKPEEVIEYRIAGWIEKALEISGCKNIFVEITKSLTRGDECTEFSMNWS